MLKITEENLVEKKRKKNNSNRMCSLISKIDQ